MVEYLDAARRAGDTLETAAVREGSGAWWPTGEKGSLTLRTNWCSGSSGAGTFLVRLWAATREERFIDLAEAAAAAIHRERWYSPLATCHGLPGDGQYLLDLADFTGQQRFRHWADDLAAIMMTRNTLRDGLMLLPDETSSDITVGYATGLSGCLAFLLRLGHGGPRWADLPFLCVGLRSHHANRSILIEGDLLPVHLNRSRSLAAAE